MIIKRYAWFFLVAFLSIFLGCKGTSHTTAENSQSVLQFPIKNEYQQRIYSRIVLEDKIWAVGTDKKKVDRVTIEMRGMRRKEGPKIIDTYEQIKILDASSREVTQKMKISRLVVKADLQEEMVESVQVEGTDIFRLQALLRGIYTMMISYPKDTRVNTKWITGRYSGESGNNSSKGIEFLVSSRKGNIVEITASMEGTRANPLERGGFKMVGSAKGSSRYTIDMKRGKWLSARVDYILGVSALKNISGVETKWAFREEVIFHMTLR